MSEHDDDPILAEMRRFYKRWGVDYAEMSQSFHDAFAADCEWKIFGFPTTYGAQEGVRKVLDPSRESLGLETIQVELLHLSRDRDIVWCERVDHLLKADGSLIAKIPILGIMELDSDGRIAKWREYIDTSARHPDALKFVESA
jgi:limonene-1,2-epoxide hydrolase